MSLELELELVRACIAVNGPSLHFVKRLKRLKLAAQQSRNIMGM